MAVASCAYTGGIENPITRKFSWFSYLGGEDIRTSCTRGADRYRFVYNANYEQQVRAYDLRPSATGSGAVLWAQIFGGPPDLSSFTPNVLEPWAGKSGRRDLTEADFRILLATLDQGSFKEPPPDGLPLNSWGYYWVASACVDGKFLFNAAAHPSPRFDALRFPEVLARFDTSGVAWAPPRAVAPDIGGQPGGGLYEEYPGKYFTLRAGPAGLKGLATLF